MDEMNERLPTPWRSYVWPKGWSYDIGEMPELNLRQVGYGLLPERFVLALTKPEWDVSPPGVTRGVLMSFRVMEEKVTVENVQAANVDLEDWLETVLSIKTWADWKAYAISEMARWLVEANRSGMPDLLATSAEGAPLMVEAKQTAPRQPGGKRYKITEQHLRDVVVIYTGAVERGEPPTKSVAEAFDVAHSTAAKWVGAARRNGLLEGVAQGWNKG
ncbi:hypothetical protein ACIQH0_13350 [Streptomyces griseus]|uniref:hypothetical protein n=1 Tax=Streptomyces griseus TaxID=1911 RepID=UPI00382AE093